MKITKDLTTSRSSGTRLKITAVLLCAVVGGGCTAKKTKDDSAASTTTNSSGGGGSFGSANTIKDLNLAGVLAIDLPASIEGKGQAAALRLTGGGKSYEACKLRQEIRDAMVNLKMASSTLCNIQSFPSLGLGKKFNLDFTKMASPDRPALRLEGDTPPPAGQEPGHEGEGADMPASMQIWADNSNPSKLNVYLCNDRKLMQHFAIDKVDASGKTKGAVTIKFEPDEQMKFYQSMSFDTTNGNETKFNLKETIDSPEYKGRRLLAMDLAGTGVSKVASSFGGSMAMGEEPATNWSFSSIGAFDQDFGSVIWAEKFGDFDHSAKAHFDGIGQIVDENNAVFREGGKVHLTESSIPKPLPAEFKPDFVPGAWDCQGTVDFDMSSVGPENTNENSCEAAWNEIAEVDCGDANAPEGDYAFSDDDITLSSEDYEEASSYEGIPEE
ncbi:MAG: hypothetical protein RL011_1207 [Pseudomonadota bacterium]